MLFPDNCQNRMVLILNDLVFQSTKKIQNQIRGLLKTYGGVIESFYESGIAKWPGALLQQ